MLRYVEAVTVNRGYRVKTFVDESEALDSLHNAT